ncbi:MAG TPA: AMP-binding protein [Gammaproteobacteria bacterium]|nr:AMP-binding protein [Gammaproteobacteria bacterium]
MPDGPPAFDPDRLLQQLPQRISEPVHRWARQAPGHLALMGDGHSWSYADFERVVADAAALLRDAGVRGGDRVRLVSENCPGLGALIIRSGCNVYPPEVERVRNSHPGITQSAVAGRPHGDDEEVVAYVQPEPRSKLDLEALRAWLRERLSPLQAARGIRGSAGAAGRAGRQDPQASAQAASGKRDG